MLYVFVFYAFIFLDEFIVVYFHRTRVNDSIRATSLIGPITFKRTRLMQRFNDLGRFYVRYSYFSTVSFKLTLETVGKW